MNKYLTLVMARTLYVIVNISFGILTFSLIILGPILYIVFGTNVFDIGDEISDRINKWFENKLQE